MEININEIASAKIKAMEESGEIREIIEDGIEETVKKAVEAACKDYEFRNEIHKGISSLLGEVAKEVNFSAYANFLRDRMNAQIERYVKDDMINFMCDSFDKMYFNIPEDIKLSDILKKYKNYLENNLDKDDKNKWGYIDFSFEYEYSTFIKIKAGRPHTTSFNSLDKGIEICLYKPKTKDNKAKITWIRFDGNNFKTSMDLSILNEFEVLMFNLMFTQKEIDIDINEDFCFDADSENEDYD